MKAVITEIAHCGRITLWVSPSWRDRLAKSWFLLKLVWGWSPLRGSDSAGDEGNGTIG